jgi:hypothetical protein
MSVHNRLLLNRAAVSRQRSLELMMAIEPSQLDRVIALTIERGGTVRRVERSIGYTRVEIPIVELVALVADPAVDAYQIASASLGSWYRDAAPRANQEMFRGFETAAPFPFPPTEPPSKSPMLTPAAARAIAASTDEYTDVASWLTEHPTFDGRGVTIALLESGEAEFAHPALQTARSLDGREVPKLVGILNAIDPTAPDSSRVNLSTEIDATSTWARIGSRTYILPRPGAYRFGLFTVPAGGNVVHQFGVLRDSASGELRVDTNGNADFRDERAVADVNERLDVASLRIAYPHPIDVPFVAAHGATPGQAHIYLSRSAHQTMTMSVAAANRTASTLAEGVASNARVLLIRVGGTEMRLSDLLEGYLEAIKRSDVDIVCDSAGIAMVPDTNGEFVGVFINRLLTVYDKPIVHGAGNSLLLLNGVSALGRAISVGGAIGAGEFSAIYGGGNVAPIAPHPLSVAGPSLDSAIKPDILAPVHRIAASTLGSSLRVELPRNAPTASLPPGYTISCCTSASSPYAAGVAALLVSAAKQRGLPYSADSIGRALRFGARLLAGAPIERQGNGVVDVSGAWQTLQSAEPARIDASGLFEREGWQVGHRRNRVLWLTRRSGEAMPIEYRVEWSGNDGTFETARRVVVPLGRPVPLEVEISARDSGVHAALLELRDVRTGALAARIGATIVAAEQFDRRSGDIRLSGTVPLMTTRSHYIAMPSSVDAVSITLVVHGGSLGAAIVPSDGLLREYYGHVFPQAGRTFTAGTYTVILPHPSPGTWSVTLVNDSIWREADRSLVSSADARYSVSIRLMRTSLFLRRSSPTSIDVEVENGGAAIEDGVLQLSPATITPAEGRFDATGLPVQVQTDVPSSAEVFAVRARTADLSHQPLDLHLYDCSSGECFSWDFTHPSTNDHTFVVRKPAPGRWIAAVNPAASPARTDRFMVDRVIASDDAPIVERLGYLAPKSRSRRRLSVPTGRFDRVKDAFVEIIDLSADADAREHRWETRDGLPNLAEVRVAAGLATLRGVVQGGDERSPPPRIPHRLGSSAARASTPGGTRERARRARTP